jgi:hypothetical protein
MGEMRSNATIIFPPVEVVGADHGGGAGPAGGGGLCALFWCGRRKKMAGLAKWVESPDGPAGRWADWAES